MQMGSYKVQHISPNVSGTINMSGCSARGGSGPGLIIRGKSARGTVLDISNMLLENTATKMWIPGAEELRFPVTVAVNGPKIGAQGGVHFVNLTVIDELELLPGGMLPPGPLEGSSSCKPLAYLVRLPGRFSY
jgi:hypothetical protein